MRYVSGLADFQARMGRWNLFASLSAELPIQFISAPRVQLDLDSRRVEDLGRSYVHENLDGLAPHPRVSSGEGQRARTVTKGYRQATGRCGPPGFDWGVPFVLEDLAAKPEDIPRGITNDAVLPTGPTMREALRIEILGLLESSSCGSSPEPPRSAVCTSRIAPHLVQNLPVAFPMIVSSSSESPDSSRPRRHVFTCQKPGIDDDVVKTIVGTTYPFGCN